MKQKEKQSLPLKEKPRRERRLIVKKLCERETVWSVEEIVRKRGRGVFKAERVERNLRLERNNVNNNVNLFYIICV